MKFKPIKQKKAFFFTITVLFLIALLLLISFSYRKEYTKESIKTRLLTTNSFLEFVEKDAERAIYISGYRTCLALLDYVLTNGYVPEFQTTEKEFDTIFNQAFLEGKFQMDREGEYYGETILSGTTIESWMQRVENNASEFGLVLQFSRPETDEKVIWVDQSDPWNIDVTLFLRYNITDENLDAIWDRSINVSGKIPIAGLEDPIYVRQFGRDLANVIHKNTSSRDDLVYDNNCSVTHLVNHIEEMGQTGSKYIESRTAQNYLSRLRGFISDSYRGTNTTTGMESIFHAKKLQDLGKPLVNGRSYVDHTYVEGTCSNRVEIINTQTELGWPVYMCQIEAETVYGIPSDCYNIVG